MKRLRSTVKNFQPVSLTGFWALQMRGTRALLKSWGASTQSQL